MARKPSVKKLVKTFSKLIAEPTDTENWSEAQRTKRRRQLARKMIKPLSRAFEDAGLDLDNSKHWEQMLFVLIAAVYAGRGPGKPKRWSNKRLRRLRSEVEEISAKDPKLTELNCCEKLVKDKTYDKKPKTLLRKLQDAKNLIR
jgi:hypothetical protein